MFYSSSPAQEQSLICFSLILAIVITEPIQYGFQMEVIPALTLGVSATSKVMKTLGAKGWGLEVFSQSEWTPLDLFFLMWEYRKVL